MTSREQSLAKAQSTVFDLAIIGGGITGAGILKEASAKGYSCILLDKGDFASGTSSKSAKLIHGGLRYLQYAQFGLVKEGLTERNYLLKAYAHLVKPIPFVYPVYDSVLKMKVGMFLYHSLGGNRNLPKSRFLTKEETLEQFPYLKSNGLKGSFHYFDAITNDARLCNEVIHEAIIDSESLAINYLGLIRSGLSSDGNILTCKDYVTGKELQVNARYIVNATGPWMDETLGRSGLRTDKFMAPSKGIHLVFSQTDFPTDCAIVFPTPFNDNRKLYALPWENNTVLVGATDTEYSGELDDVKVDQSDTTYILKSIAAIFPGLNVTEQQIISHYAGLRPLFGEESASSKDKSRDFKIWWTGKRWVNIVGGKLTTFRHMASQLVKELERKISASGSGKNLDQPAMSKMKIAAIMDAEPDSRRTIHVEYEVTVAEVLYYIRYQSCVYLEDLMHRRLSLGYVLPVLPEEVIREIGSIMSSECGWSREQLEDEIKKCGSVTVKVDEL